VKTRRHANPSDGRGGEQEERGSGKLEPSFLNRTAGLSLGKGRGFVNMSDTRRKKTGTGGSSGFGRGVGN